MASKIIIKILISVIILCAGVVLWFSSHSAGLGFIPLYPGPNLNNYGYTAKPTNVTVQDGVRVLSFSIQNSTGTRVAFSEQADANSEAVAKLGEITDKQYFKTKWGPAILVHSTIAGIDINKTAVFAQLNGSGLKPSEWTSIFNSLSTTQSQ